MKKVIASIAITVSVAGYIAFDMVSKKFQLNDTIKAATVRLHNEEGRFFCSGFMVDEHTVVTAAHCVMEYGMFGPVGLRQEPIQVRSAAGRLISMGIPKAGNSRADLAIIEISAELDEATLPLESDPTAITESLGSHKLLLCGYPYGGKLYCAEYKNLSQYWLTNQGNGTSWPGMSGGPLVDLDTGKVIANLHGATENTIIVNPFIEIWDMLLGR